MKVWADKKRGAKTLAARNALDCCKNFLLEFIKNKFRGNGSKLMYFFDTINYFFHFSPKIDLNVISVAFIVVLFLCQAKSPPSR